MTAVLLWAGDDFPAQPDEYQVYRTVYPSRLEIYQLGFIDRNPLRAVPLLVASFDPIRTGDDFPLVFHPRFLRWLLTQEWLDRWTRARIEAAP